MYRFSMSEQMFIQGPVGQIEVFVDYPQGEVKGFAVVTHPHPLQGGTPQHKVPALLAQMFLERGCIVYRPSFRGSGQSVGLHDEGHGETDDVLEVIKHARAAHTTYPSMQVVLVSVRMSWQNAMMLYKKKFDQNKPFYVVYQRQRSQVYATM